MKKQYLIFIFFLFATKTICQNLLPPLEDFSKKKPAYLIKTDSTRIDFVLSEIYHKKGLIAYIIGKTTKGEKFELEADSILILALPPSNSAKLSGIIESSRSLTRIKQTDKNEFNRELVYFFQEYIEERETTVLLQLLNPDFSDKIAIYHDPWAFETLGGGFIGGSIDKSYYLNVNGKTKRYVKKNYNTTFEKLFESCPVLITRYKKYNTIYWTDLPQHVYLFDTKCE